MANTEMTAAAAVDDRAAALAWTLQLAQAAAREAEAMARRGGAASMSLKADGTIVTEIDRAIERLLREGIRSAYPDDAILGEEYGMDDTAGGNAPRRRLWALDPIDGTTNLANGLPHWAVSVCLIENDEPIVGVVAAPLLGETYAGATGLGATLNGTPLPALPPGGPTDWEQTYAICSDSVRRMEFSRLAARLRVFGSAALELCWTASGVVRGCQSIGTKLYDIGAGICIAREVGAQAAWLSGREWTAPDMARRAPVADDLLITAPPDTLRHIKERLAWR